MDCVRCKGNVRSPYSCNKPFCPILQKFHSSMPKPKINFSGSSPPDLFVGQYNYPNVYTGILSPMEHNENSNKLSSSEEWFKERISIENILHNRGSMVYSRFVSNIKRSNKLLNTMQEVSMASKPCSMEFFLAKKPRLSMEMSDKMAPIGNPAPLVKANFQENPKIERKVDYAVSDIDLKATDAVCNLHDGNIDVSSMIKLLSAGLLGIKKQRKLVPSRWSTTAVDDIISKNLLKKIKYYPWISDYEVYHEEYLGNHYEILLLPRQWSFEVIEAKMPGSVWNPDSQVTSFMQDHEDFYGRKKYAFDVSGAYYANRLAVSEYLKLRKRQASVLVFREVRDEYYAPCGVGILREASRSAFLKKGEPFSTLKAALDCMSSRLKIPADEFAAKSRLLSEINTQKTLKSF